MGEIADAVKSSSRMGTIWGFVVVLLGVLAMMMPFVSGIAVTTLVTIFVIAAGITMTMYAFKAGSFVKGLFQFLFGGITILAGVAMFTQPMLGMYTLTAVLMGWFLVDGIFSLIAGFKAKPVEGWGWVVISGIASIVLAILMWRQWPATGQFAIGLLVGIRLIFTGWSIAMIGAVGDAVGDQVGKVGDEIRQAVASEAKTESPQ